MLTSLWQNLTVGAHNWPHSSDTETTPVRAGSSASPPHKPKEPAEVVQTSCNMDVPLVHNPISPWVCGAPLSTLPSQPARGIWGHWCRDSLTFSCCLPTSIRNAHPQHQGLCRPPQTLLPPTSCSQQLTAPCTLPSRQEGRESSLLPLLATPGTRGRKRLHLQSLS